MSLQDSRKVLFGHLQQVGIVHEELESICLAFWQI